MAEARMLLGQYRLVERLGSGGMSVVWQGYDEVLGRSVAIKVLSPELIADPESRDRIRAEAKTAAALSNPHLVNVYDYGEADEDGAAVPFVVMELVAGNTLAARLAAGPPPLPGALRVGAEIASGLAAAHARDLVHRDVKPANVMITDAGVKVVDFGLAANTGDLVDDPEDGTILGTAAYIAPERVLGRPVTPATDVYALGLLLYKALCGRNPWRDIDTTGGLVRAHCERRPAPLPAVPGLPSEVPALVMKCLSKDPSRRPTSVDVAAELNLLARVDPPAGSPVPASPVPAAPDPRRRRLVRIGAAAATVVVAGIAVATLPRASQWRGPAQATGSGPASGVGRAPACEVRYAIGTSAAGVFAVDLTLTHSRGRAEAGWTLAFEFPGNQQIQTTSTGGWSQTGRKVTVRPVGNERSLAPNKALPLAFTGSFHGVNKAPNVFTFNGTRCAAKVSGGSTAGTGSGDPAGGTAAGGGAGPTPPPAPGNGSSGGGSAP